MKSYSPVARLFIVFIGWCGVLAAATIRLLPEVNSRQSSPSLLGLTLVLAFVAGSRKVSLVRSPRLSEKYCISLGFFVTIFCLTAFGTHACVWAAIISATGACVFPRRLPWHQFLFNVSALAITAWITAFTYALLKMSALPWMRLPFLQTLCAACIYFLINSGCLAAIISLCSSKPIREVWKALLWTGPSYLAGASLAMLVQLWAGSNTNLLLTVPVLAFLQQSYQTHVDKLEESKSHLAQRELYIEELQQSRQMLTDLYTSTVHSLASAIDAKDEGTHAHIQRVQRFAVGIAGAMSIEGVELEAIRTGALLHDIGKLGVPDHILLKPGALTEDEFRQMKQHCVIGAEILEPVNFPWPVTDVVRHHHERWDGRGYPEGLSGTAIPRSARVMTVADVYDALTSDRPYRSAWTQERALEYLREQRGIQFDPEVVAALIHYLAQEEAPLATEETPRTLQSHHRHAMHSIQRNTAKAGTLYDISQLLNADMPLEERLKRVCQRTVAAMPDADCAILVSTALLDGAFGADQALHKKQSAMQDDTLRIVAAAGARGVDFCRKTFPGPNGLVELSGPSSLRFTRPVSLVETDSTPTASLLLPLVYAEKPLGALCVIHSDPGALSEEEQCLLTSIADQVQRDLYNHLQFQRTHAESMTDPLTGLHNIRFLASPLHTNSLLSPYSVLYLDLDNFKPINDIFGHSQGDSVLKDIAYLLQCTLRPADQIVRCGGDEFVVILPMTSFSEGEQIARRLHEAVEAYDAGLVAPSGDGVKIAASIGMACCPADGQELLALVSVADTRMYMEKTAHKRSLLTPYALISAAVVEETTPFRPVTSG